MYVEKKFTSFCQALKIRTQKKTGSFFCLTVNIVNRPACRQSTGVLCCVVWSERVTSAVSQQTSPQPASAQRTDPGPPATPRSPDGGGSGTPTPESAAAAGCGSRPASSSTGRRSAASSAGRQSAAAGGGGGTAEVDGVDDDRARCSERPTASKLCTEERDGAVN